jgi:hypothetical protein
MFVRECGTEIRIKAVRFHLDPGQLHMFVKSSTIVNEREVGKILPPFTAHIRRAEADGQC